MLYCCRSNTNIWNYVSVATLQQLKSVFQIKVNWNKYQSKVVKGRQNQYLGYLIDLSFMGVNRLFLLSFKDKWLKGDAQAVFLQA